MFQSQKTIKLIKKACLVLTITASLSACTLNQQPVVSQPTMQSNNPFTTPQTALFHSAKANLLLHDASPAELEKLISKYEVKSRILDQYSDWKGVRYRLGGTTKKGVDCSAFVQITFREQFGLDLPRTTAELHQTGVSIPHQQLKTGDLVLFNIDSRTRHVGIYLGNNKFVHASTSKGVMISNLKDSYWKKRYKDGRRVLSAANLTNLA
jgi:lipoprotein Spr